MITECLEWGRTIRWTAIALAGASLTMKTTAIVAKGNTTVVTNWIDRANVIDRERGLDEDHEVPGNTVHGTERVRGAEKIFPMNIQHATIESARMIPTVITRSGGEGDRRTRTGRAEEEKTERQKTRIALLSGEADHYRHKPIRLP